MISLSQAVLMAKNGNDEISRMRKYIAASYPHTIRALRMIDTENASAGRGRGFCLEKRESKKFGTRYYVRYYHEGKMLLTRWNTGHGSREDAERFAAENRARLVEGYLSRGDTRMHDFFESFYCAADEAEAARKRINISRRKICEYRSVMTKKFVPFLKSRRITGFDGITAAVLDDFQDHMLGLGLRPQTANSNMKAVRKIFAYLTRKGMTAENPAKRIQPLPVERSDYLIRGCYESDRLAGVFERPWRNGTSRLLIMLVYTTGLRNGEIERICGEDVQYIEGRRFLCVRETKTGVGTRLVPLHDFVHAGLEAFAAGRGGPLFGGLRRKHFAEANADLAGMLGAEEEMARENITFYSGRHFWKTLMSAEGLGEDVEEMFMGHKVSSNVAKLYNHRDRHGKKNLAKKAGKVFAILDRCVFGAAPR